MGLNETSVFFKRIALLILFSVSTGSAVSAQTPQGAERNLDTILSPGMTVWITHAGGQDEKTRIVGVSGDIVTTTTGAAVASGLFLCRMMEPWENCLDDVGPMIRIGALGAGIGIGIDALIRGRKTIYESARGTALLHAAPIVGRRTGGVQFSLSF